MSIAEAGPGIYRSQIIDAHHHLWDLSMDRRRWLTRPGPGALAALSGAAESYGVKDYRREAERENIFASVHAEALWSGDPVGKCVGSTASTSARASRCATSRVPGSAHSRPTGSSPCRPRTRASAWCAAS